MALDLTVTTFDVRDTELGVPNGDPDTVYTLRQLDRPTIKGIVAKYQKLEPNPRSHRMEKVTVDGGEERANEDMLDYVLVGWAGMLDSGVPAVCNRENKLKLDARRMLALLERAGLTQAQAGATHLAESFRGPA